MTTKVGVGEYKYSVAVDWQTLPDGYEWSEATNIIDIKAYISVTEFEDDINNCYGYINYSNNIK